jgi:hypothetical protein
VLGRRRGAKGPRPYAWTRMWLNRHLGLSRWLLFRRGVEDGKVVFYIAHARRNDSLESLVRSAGSRWRRTSSPPRVKWVWRTTGCEPGRSGTGT